ncbi:MAG: HemK2/MTQ2 family protein methyltransferase [Methanomicrobiales archaeon]
MHRSDERVYPPREDTWLLLKTARNEVRADDRVLEVGCGSGEVAAGLAPVDRVVATDINPHALRLTRSRGVAVVRTDLCAGLLPVFDLVVFNPPYLPTGPDERIDDWLEYALDGGEDGREVISRFSRMVAGALAPGGRVLLLVSSLTGPDAVRTLMENAGLQTEIVAREEMEDEVLFVIRAVLAGDAEEDQASGTRNSSSFHTPSS